MADIPADLLKKFVAGCHKAARHGLMRCSSGNLSWRMEGDRMLLTASRTWLSDITEDQVAVCRISDGQLLSGRKPTVETGFHAGIMRDREDVTVVMHFQTPCATAVTCMEEEDLNFFVIPEIPYYIGPVSRVPFLIPGSPELADAVTRAMAEHDMVLMGNHGQVTVGTNFDDVIQKAAFFELACEVILRSGGRAQPISSEDVGLLRALALSTRHAAPKGC